MPKDRIRIGSVVGCIDEIYSKPFRGFFFLKKGIYVVLIEYFVEKMSNFICFSEKFLFQIHFRSGSC
jgi:hypothetical protein